jgi:tRNA-2-methylthio-N6-dimethylallyladenosine synthase
MDHYHLHPFDHNSLVEEDIQTLEGGLAPKKVLIKSYGCQMNVYESEKIAKLLGPLGYAQTESLNEANLVVLNTCHIREKAAEKIYSEIGRLKDAREEALDKGRGRMEIVVAGCVAQAEGAEILNRAPAVDYVVGPQSLHQLPELLLAGVERQGFRRPQSDRIRTDFDPIAKFRALNTGSQNRINSRAPTAFLSVQEGCDKFCTFCVVPYTRGAEWSRPMADIITEAQILADQGVREITLLGQNVNAYNGLVKSGAGARSSLAELLWALSEIKGLDRLRYTTSHPNDMSDDLLDCHKQLATLMPYLHLPVQSGSDRILKAMNRRHTAKDYSDIIARVREVRPDIAISGDFIVGFPGECESDFEQTLELVKSINYASAYWFKYSPRPGTPAADLSDQINEAVKDERLQTLQTLLLSQQEAFKAELVGQTLDVLFEKKGRQDNQAIGRSPYLQSVFVDNADHLIGQIVPVRISALSPNSLKGTL